jgi:hypothetical protein
MNKWVHSIPVWTLSPRSANAKFQGGVTLAGIPSVRQRLAAIQKLSKKLSGRVVPGGSEPLLTSVHMLHELKSGIREWQKHNSPWAISFRELKAGIKRGDFPRILAVTAPAFGFAGAEGGVILSSDPKKVQMAKDLCAEAANCAAELKYKNLGEQVVIWWPAFDSRRLDLLDGSPLAFDEAWKRMVDFWVSLLRPSGQDKVWLEWKPSDPGIDYICTLGLAIRFCNEVNKEAGYKAMFINNEWAHLLIGGLTVAEGTRRTIEAGLFTGFVHVNSAQILPMSIENVLLEGCLSPAEIGSGTDWDWAVGIGSERRWVDQVEAVGLMDDATIDGGTIFAEHDINPGGQDPIEYATLSINNLERMLGQARPILPD